MKLFETWGEVIIKDAGVESKLSGIDSKAGKLDGVFSKLGKAALVVGAAIGGAMTFALKDGVQGIKEAQDAAAQTNAVLKSTGDVSGMTAKQVLAMGDALELTTKFTSEQTQGAENMLLTFTNIGQNVFPQATKTAMDMAQALGTDAKGQAMQLGKALNDPIKGISALTRVGVTFTEGQKATIKSMQDAGDTAGAQKIILAELSKEFGGSATAAGKTFSGQLEIIKNSFGAVTQSVAEKLLPYLQQLMTWAITNMPGIQTTMSKTFDVITILVKDFASGVIWVKDNLNWLIPVLTGTVGALGALKIINLVIGWQKLWKASTIAQTIAQGGLNAVMLANPIGIVIIAIGLLIAAGVAIWMNWDKIEAKASKLWDSFKSVFGKIKSFVGGVWEYISTKVEQFTDKIDKVVDKVKKAFNAVKNFFGLGDSDTSKKSTTSLAGGRASGGNVSKGNAYRIGEQGEEIFTPKVNGYVVSNSKLSGYSNNNSNNDNNGFIAKAVSLLQSILDKTGNDLVLDTGTLVGSTASLYDKEFGKLRARRK